MSRALCFMVLASLLIAFSSLPALALDESDKGKEPPSRIRANAAEAAINWTPLLVRQSVEPQLFQGSDLKYNLVYELVLSSWIKHPIKLDVIEIVDAGKNVVIKKLSEKDLKGVLVEIDGSSQNVLKGGSSAIAYINLDFEKPEQAPEKIIHRISYRCKGPDSKSLQKVTETIASPVRLRPALVIAPPLRNGKWVAFGGYCGVVGHRRTLFAVDNKTLAAQRYAIDWCRLDEENYSSRGPLVENSSAYAQPVYAVADALVFGVKDGFENQKPGKPEGSDRYSFPGGNSITLDLGNGYYGFYAHLKPGSIKVKPGEKVKRGQEIARLGNSGNTTGPHLHFHVTDDPHILGSNGVPYVFDEFKLVGEVTDLKKFFLNDDSGRPQGKAIGDSKFAGSHRLHLVKEGHIVDFGKP